MTVLCLVEHDRRGPIDASLAALTFARTLAWSADGPEPGSAAPLAAAVIGGADELPIGPFSDFGVTDTYAVQSELLSAYAPLAWARALTELIAVSSAEVVLAAGTDRGHEVLAHVGAITGAPVAANCLRATRSGDHTYRIVRQRWAGSLLEDAVLEASPALFTVATDGVAASAAATAVGTRVHVHRPALSGADVRVRVGQSAAPSTGVSLASARVVVGGGRGVGGPDGFAMLEELANLLGGAVGVSRVVTSLGWRPHKQQVGQTGTRIAPELYLACGISGAIQHMAGCLGAKQIIAINTDPGAPIIGRADYAVIGDLNEVIPALIAAIKARGS